MIQTKRRFRLRIDDGLTPGHRAYAVQAKVLGMWFTLKRWEVDMIAEPTEDEYIHNGEQVKGYSRICAEELLAELEKND